MCKRITVFGLLFVFAFGMAFAQERGDPIIANIDYSLSFGDLERLSDLAMDGSANAAEKVYNYYNNIKRDERKSLKWALIGAENGSADLQLMVFQALSVSKKVDDQRRALFLLRRSAQGGNEVAIAIYDDCKSLDSHFGNPKKTPCFGPKKE